MLKLLHWEKRSWPVLLALKEFLSKLNQVKFKECHGTWYTRGFFSMTNVGSGFQTSIFDVLLESRASECDLQLCHACSSRKLTRSPIYYIPPTCTTTVLRAPGNKVASFPWLIYGSSQPYLYPIFHLPAPPPSSDHQATKSLIKRALWSNGPLYVSYKRVAAATCMTKK